MPQAGLTEMETQALERIAAAASVEELESVRVDVLGRKGTLARISKDMGKLSPAERAELGKRLNAVKQSVDGALSARKLEFEQVALRARLDAEWVDLTLPSPGPAHGSLHPVTQVQAELEDLFSSMGFAVLSGP